jgi:penicillin-binding protein 1C
MLAGNDLFVKVLGSLGIEELKEGDFYGPAIALGTAEVSLWELVGAYRSLANGGLWDQLRMTSAGDENPSKRRRIFSKETTFLVSDILSDREARGYTFGFQNPLATRFWSAVKTGTSKDMRDNWCVGYSKDYTVGVWVGNFNNAPMWNVSGVSGAAPVWLDIMHYLHRGSLPLPPVPPEGVVSQKITDRDGHSIRTEWFIRGTEPKEGNQVWAEAAYKMREPKIAYPSHGMIIAIDPDIPSEQQKVFFETNSALPKTKWLLNGSFLGSSEMIIWAPVRGDYELVLTDDNDRLLDKISFQVR